MKKRNGFTVMAKLIGLVRPLAGYMLLAIIMGLLGHLAASFITIFGGFAVLWVGWLLGGLWGGREWNGCGGGGDGGGMGGGGGGGEVVW